MKTAFITGCLGQDGAYLAHWLLQKGYKVFGGYRKSGSLNPWRLHKLGIEKDVELIPIEILEYTNIQRCIERIRPTEIYNLAAQSFVGASFDNPILTSDVNGLSTTRILDALRAISPETRFFQASTSEIFGKSCSPQQTEQSPFMPQTTYGIAKLYSHWMTAHYRDAHKLHASSGILFNHESPLRGREFITRKITSTFSQMAEGADVVLELGNIDSERDWGFAGDYVQGMWLMLQQEKPDDYIFASGKKTSVRRFVELSAQICGFSLAWEGEGVKTIGRDQKSGRVLVQINPIFFRPIEVDPLVGDARKANTLLGWTPKTSLEQLVQMMVDEDRQNIRSQHPLF